MDIDQTDLPGLLLVTPTRYSDDRGFFSETWNKSRYLQHGIKADFVQDNHSFSAMAGTVRGLHFQAPPHAQTKLVRCGRGRIFDVAVDIRRGSPTYGRWFGVELSFENGRQLLIPAGFAHGFATLEANSEIVYKCSDYYAPETEGALRYDDPIVGVEWGLEGLSPILSNKDATAGSLIDFESPFMYQEIE